VPNPWNLTPLPINRPQLTFAPLAWLKLQYFCHAGATEIGGFGISAEKDLLYVQDFVTVSQKVSAVTVRFADDAVADFFDECVDQGLPPDRFARIWCHTHPGASVTPSGVDEDTFAHSFGRCDWSVMFILGRTGRTYARLAFTVGPGVQVELPTAVDWSRWPKALAASPDLLGGLPGQWEKEYAAHIQRLEEPRQQMEATPFGESVPTDPWWGRGLEDAEMAELIYEPTMEYPDHERE
jgi:proteasome lid subunit RPN8/RPN11